MLERAQNHTVSQDAPISGLLLDIGLAAQYRLLEHKILFSLFHYFGRLVVGVTIHKLVVFEYFPRN